MLDSRSLKASGLDNLFRAEFYLETEARIAQ